MAQVNRVVLKSYFETGDKPTQAEFINFIESVYNFIDDQVETTEIADLAVTTAKLAALAVTSAKIADLNVTSGKIADLAVITTKLNALAVTTAKINNLAITAAKIAADAVDKTKINPDVAGTGLSQNIDGSLELTLTNTYELVKTGNASGDDGNWRFTIDGSGNFLTQKRTGGAWVTTGSEIF